MNRVDTMKLLFYISLASLFATGGAAGKITVDGVEVTDSDEHYLKYARYIIVPSSWEGQINNQQGGHWDQATQMENALKAGNPPSVEAIHDLVTWFKTQYASTGWNHIFSSMKGSSEVFAFDSPYHARDTAIQRVETLRMMDHFNFDHRYRYWDLDLPPTPSAANWEVGDPPRRSLFRQTSGLAYDAIQQITAPLKTYAGADNWKVLTGVEAREDPTRGECLGAAKACIWWGASRAMGQTRFNQLYPAPNGLNMGEKSKNLSLVQDKNTLVPGDFVYFQNDNYGEIVAKKEFKDKNIWNGQSLLNGDSIYSWAGENAFYVGKNSNGERMFEGLGLDLTEKAMRAYLAERYNTQLHKVITEAAKHGGKLLGLKVTEIAPEDVQITNESRPKH